MAQKPEEGDQKRTRAFDKPGRVAAFDSPKRVSKQKLIVAIDFGTTYTGVAYAFADTDRQHELDEIERITNVVKTWPNKTGVQEEKTPSVISYENDSRRIKAWGGQVSDNDTAVRYFKLGLEEPVRQRLLKESGAALLGGFLSDVNWKDGNTPHSKSPEYVADYLACVRQYIQKVVLPGQYGKAFLRNVPVSFALTVPAIWSEKAKELTRKAAISAGISANSLSMITEPEAAALYCSTNILRTDLNEGDRFVVCDAGGGTVVISREPKLRIEEATEGSGALCGAVFLDRGFEALIRDRFEKAKQDKYLTGKLLKEALKHFESSIKRQFNPFDSTCEDEYYISMTKVPDTESVGIIGGYLVLTKNEIDSIFQPLFQRILKLVQEQIKSATNTTAKVKTVFLVGGFGGNLYLRQFLESKIDKDIELLSPANAWSAITRGALVHLLDIKYVKSRVLRQHYGLTVTYPFDERKHPKHLKFEGKDGDRCQSVMEWLTHRGQRVIDGDELIHPCRFYATKTNIESDYLEHSLELKKWSQKEAPIYDDPEGTVPALCSLTVNLKGEKERFIEREGADGSSFFDLPIELAIKFGPTVEFRYLNNEGKVLGETVANYD